MDDQSTRKLMSVVEETMDPILVSVWLRAGHKPES